MLKLENICKTYNLGTVNETTLFTNFNLEVKKGEFISVIGSNGSGKTSILNMICGSIPVDSGRILVQGQDITRMKEHQRSKFIGRVFQDPAKGTCPSMNILQNMAMADNKGKPFNLTAGINKKRIPYYQEQLNEWVRLFAKAFNGILTQEGSSDVYGDPGRILFTGNLAVDRQLSFRHEEGVNGEITSSSDCYRMLTAANFGINEDILEIEIKHAYTKEEIEIILNRFKNNKVFICAL